MWYCIYVRITTQVPGDQRVGGCAAHTALQRTAATLWHVAHGCAGPLESMWLWCNTKHGYGGGNGKTGGLFVVVQWTQT